MREAKILPALLAAQLNTANAEQPELETDTNREQSAITEGYVNAYNAAYRDFIQPDQCEADLSEFPTVALRWREMNGPLVKTGEAGIWLGQQRHDEEMEMWTEPAEGPLYEGEDYKIDQDVFLDSESFSKNVEVILVIDQSGSMDDNSKLTDAIIRQVRAKNPKANESGGINVRKIFYTETGVQNVASQNSSGWRSGLPTYSYSRSEEQHVPAVEEAINMLNVTRHKGPTDKHIFVLTDEGNKRKGDDIEAAISKARQSGIHVHLIYDPYESTGRCVEVSPPPRSTQAFYTFDPYSNPLAASRSGLVRGRSGSMVCRAGYKEERIRSEENFQTLKRLAQGTGGGAIEMTERGTVPNIFRTERITERFGEIQVKDTWPLKTGERAYSIVNGEGAICSATVSKEDIERAIIEGRIEEPTFPEEAAAGKSSAFKLPQIKLPDWLKNRSWTDLGIGAAGSGALFGLVGFLFGRRRKPL